MEYPQAWSLNTMALLARSMLESNMGRTVENIVENLKFGPKKILDLKRTHMDKQVLTILVRAVMEDLANTECQASSKHKDRVQKLLARLTVSMLKETAPWKLYCILLTRKQEEDRVKQDDVVRGVQYYQTSLEVISLALTMVEVVRTVERVQELQLAYYMRLGISSPS